MYVFIKICLNLCECTDLYIKLIALIDPIILVDIYIICTRNTLECYYIISGLLLLLSMAIP